MLALGRQARPAADGLAELLDDPAPNVRLAAAEALCGLGREADALPVLVEGLKAEDPRVRLCAAISVVAIGEKARPATAEMKNALTGEAQGPHAQYVRWALTYALKNLDR